MKNDIMKSKSFYSHHSVWGSYFSFIVGKIGYGGGFVQNDVKPPANNIYIGYKKGKAKPELLPFFSKIKLSGEEKVYQSNKGNETVDWCRKHAKIFKASGITRKMNWASESWEAENLKLTILTPFTNIPDPEKMDKESARFYFCPAIFIQLEFDNRRGKEEMTGLFALRDMKRVLSDTRKDTLLGTANNGSYGFAVKPDNNIKENLSWNIVEDSLIRNGRVFRMGNEGGLSFTIPKGEKNTFTIALGSYKGGAITSGMKTHYYYTQLFSSLEEVLEYALANFDRYYKIVLEKDNELNTSGLNEYKKFMIAHFTRSYIANTQLLISEKKELLFIVNEGEYQLMNTLDLTIDQVFWEMHFTPWTVRNVLESFLKYYRYEDYLQYSNHVIKKGALCFCHDQGIANMFAPAGYSSYELSGLRGCFSYMTYEEILNWLIIASIYVLRGNNADWLREKSDVFADLFNSVVMRDENNDGVMDKDSSRCHNGAEITTYDCLDASLGQARNNLYLAVKTWAAYVCFEKIFGILNEQRLWEQAGEKARLCAATIISKYNVRTGYIPAVFEENNQSKIIPAIEGLVYPYIIGDDDAVSFNGRFSQLIQILKLHLENVLVPGICINSKTRGWQLSSTSRNSWMSKIIQNQFVAEKILKIESDDWEKWDKIHSSWQQDGCSFSAATDQIDSSNGKVIGSRLYPRLVTSLLWLKY